MARIDAIVLGAGIVGTSVALQLVKRGLAVALIDRRAPGERDLWLAYGHAHWGLTLGPATGRLLAEMMTGATPFCDPAPYGAGRFG